MNIRVLCIGKLKESYWAAAAAEYRKRLGAYVSIEVLEFKEERLPAHPSKADEQRVIEREGERLLAHIGASDVVCALAIEGQQLDSLCFSRRLMEIFDGGAATVDFLIGGSLGLSAAVKERADYRLSFSPMTFPHQLARVLLLEQIYRAYKIARGETYHK